MIKNILISKSRFLFIIIYLEQYPFLLIRMQFTIRCQILDGATEIINLRLKLSNRTWQHSPLIYISFSFSGQS